MHVLTRFRRTGNKSRERDELFDAVGHGIEQLVHQLRFLHLRNIDDGLHSAALAPSGFGMGAATARQIQYAGVSPLQRLNVVGELLLRRGMRQTVCVLRKRPICAIRVDVGPMETVAALWRIPKILDLVTVLPQPTDDFGEIGVAPTGSDIGSSHW